MVVVLAACEGVPVRDADTADWEQHRLAVTQLKSWTLKGRLAIHYDNEGGQGILYWQQDQGHYELRMLDPLGRQLVEITGDDAHARMQTREGDIFESENAESLMQAYLGWSVPVIALNQWVRGVPGDGLAVDESQLEHGRLSLLVQEDWRIEYQAYEQVDRFWLPRRLRITTPDLNIKLIVEQWNLS
jgi:outer membrane lipoprotein LolB